MAAVGMSDNERSAESRPSRLRAPCAQMTVAEEHLTLTLIEAQGDRRDARSRLHLQASIAVTAFTGQSEFTASLEAVGDFVEQLAALADGLSDSAQIECGLVDGDTDVIYFRCHLEASPPGFVGHVSLGTAGSDGLLQRLHAGLRIAPAELGAFRRDLEQLLAGRSKTAVMRAPGAAPRASRSSS
jgi:hypothetical protein